jgi:hypothetical protein
MYTYVYIHSQNLACLTSSMRVFVCVRISLLARMHSHEQFLPCYLPVCQTHALKRQPCMRTCVRACSKETRPSRTGGRGGCGGGRANKAISMSKSEEARVMCAGHRHANKHRRRAPAALPWILDTPGIPPSESNQWHAQQPAAICSQPGGRRS